MADLTLRTLEHVLAQTPGNPIELIKQYHAAVVRAQGQTRIEMEGAIANLPKNRLEDFLNLQAEKGFFVFESPNKVPEHLLSHLRSVTFSDCDDRSIKIISRMTRLQGLKLTGCKKITTKGLKHLKNTPLNTLSLEGCSGISDDSLNCLSELPLQELLLGDCIRITDDGLQHLQNLPLRKLGLEGCSKITDSGMLYLVSHDLETLHISYCSYITDLGLKYLEGMPLKELSLLGCLKITETGLDFFKQRGVKIIK